MATQQRRRSREGDVTTDDQGRAHDSMGRFVSEDEQESGSSQRRSSSSQGTRHNGQSRSRHQEDGEDMVDDQGRVHGESGRFTSGDESSSSGRSMGHNGGASHSGGQSRRLITRAVRVLDEIETRISELREELEEQGGGMNGSRSSSRSSSSHRGYQDSEGHSSDGRGRVPNPATDHRLRENRDN